MHKQNYFSSTGWKRPFRRSHVLLLMLAAVVAAGSLYLPRVFAAAEQYDWQPMALTTNGVDPSASTISGDGNTMYVASDAEGVTFYSSDRGVTWQERAYPGTQNIWDIETTSNGTKVVALRAGNVYISTDAAQTWSAPYYVGCGGNELDMSGDGTKLIVGCSNGGYIYTSVDGGSSWVQRTGAGSHKWQSVAVSAGGTRMVAAESDTGTSTQGNVYTSTDDGATWTMQAGAGTRYWRSVDISSDAGTLIGLAMQGPAYETPSDIFRSTDGGVTWTQQSGLGSVIDADTGIQMSANGTTIAVSDRNVASDNPVVRVSTDGGVSWAHVEEFDFYYYMQNIGVSADGQTILISSQQGPVVLSKDQGASWSIQGGIRSDGAAWTDIATSFDGKKVWTGNWYPSGALQFSSDAGASWTDLNTIGSHDLDGVAASADGQYVTATGGCSWAPTYLHVSSDGGQTWSQKVTDVAREWDQVAMSADGRVQAATICGAHFYVSQDYGQTWTAKFDDVGRSWTDIAVSADGTRLVATVYNGGIYVSTDSGQTWTLSTAAGTHRYYHMAMSADGMTVIVGTKTGAAGEGFLYRSTDGGATWQQIATIGLLGWNGVAMSADGRRIAASGGGSIYVSNDAGASWEAQATLENNSYELAMSGDGTVLYAVSGWATAYRGVSTIAPDAPAVSTRGILAGDTTISGVGTPGSDMIVTFPNAQQATDQMDIFGKYSVDVPSGLTLKVGDSITLQERTAAGVLGVATTVTVQAPVGSLADTGMNLWMVVTIGGGLVAVSLMLARRFIPRRMTF